MRVTIAVAGGIPAFRKPSFATFAIIVICDRANRHISASWLPGLAWRVSSQAMIRIAIGAPMTFKRLL